MTNLSSAAQAVDDATCYDMPNRVLAAAAIRVAADQLINVEWSVEMWELHHAFHAIATALETL